MLSSFVFIGGQFAAAMFNERDFEKEFGPLGENQIKAGPVGRFSYSEGKYDFWVAPDRIDLRCRDEAALPETLIDAAQSVADRLEPARPVISVSAIGINCDAVFPAQEIGQDGISFCRSLTDTSLSRRLVELPSSTPIVVFAFPDGAVRYQVRLEPEPQQSQGKDLVVAINGHQDVTTSDPLRNKLDAVEEVRNWVTELHDRLRLPQGE